MPKRKSSRKKMKRSTKRNLIATFIIVIVAVVGFYYIKDVEWKEEQEARSMATRTKNELYITLENRDSLNYISSIELGKNTNILLLSNAFYENEVFWPYIFEANNKIENPLDIPKGTVLKIPRIESELLDMKSTENVERVRTKGDSILQAIQESRIPRWIE